VTPAPPIVTASPATSAGLPPVGPGGPGPETTSASTSQPPPPPEPPPKSATGSP
jgi:hypothetical protein